MTNLTDEQLREIAEGDEVTSVGEGLRMAIELLALRARVAQLEAALREAEAICCRYAIPSRFRISDTWRDDMTPAEVYETACIDVASWIKKEIAALAQSVESDNP